MPLSVATASMDRTRQCRRSYSTNRTVGNFWWYLATFLLVNSLHSQLGVSADFCDIQNLHLCPVIRRNGVFHSIRGTFQTSGRCPSEEYTVSIKSEFGQTSYQIHSQGNVTDHQFTIQNSSLPDLSGKYKVGVYANTENSMGLVEHVEAAYVYGCTQNPGPRQQMCLGKGDSCCKIQCRFACNTPQLMSYSLTIVAKGRGNLRRLTSSGSLRRVVQTTCFTDNTTYNVVALGTSGQVLPQVQLDNKLKLVNRLNLVTPPPVVATLTTQQSQNASETTAADTSNTEIIIISLSVSLGVVFVVLVAIVVAIIVYAKKKVKKTIAVCKAKNVYVSTQPSQLQPAVSPETRQRVPSGYYDTIDNEGPPNIVVTSPIEGQSYMGDETSSHTYEDMESTRPVSTTGSDDTYTSLRSLQRLRGAVLASLNLTANTFSDDSTTTQTGDSTYGSLAETQHTYANVQDNVDSVEEEVYI